MKVNIPFVPWMPWKLLEYHIIQEISNGRTHVSRTPKKTWVSIIARLRNLRGQRGPLGFGPIQILMDP